MKSKLVFQKLMHLQGLTHEVQVSLPSQAMGKQSDHLVELDAPINNGVHWNQSAHVGVHILVHQPEGQRFVSHQGLTEQADQQYEHEHHIR